MIYLHQIPEKLDLELIYGVSVIIIFFLPFEVFEISIQSQLDK